MPHPPTTPGASIRTLRLMAGMTLEDAATAAGVSPAYLSRVETGAARAKPTWIAAVVAAIADQLAVPA